MSEIKKTKTVNKEEVNKKTVLNNKTLMWSIIIVIVVIVLYVLFGENKKKFRLNTEVRNQLPTVSANSVNTMTPVSASALSVSPSSATAVRNELANLFKSYV